MLRTYVLVGHLDLEAFHPHTISSVHFPYLLFALYAMKKSEKLLETWP